MFGCESMFGCEPALGCSGFSPCFPLFSHYSAAKTSKRSANKGKLCEKENAVCPLAGQNTKYTTGVIQQRKLAS